MGTSDVYKSLLIALGALASTPGCSEPVDFFPAPLDIQWEGDHVYFASDDAIDVCGGSWEYLDEHTGRLKSIQGEDVGPISYFTVPIETVRDACRSEAALACAAPDKVYASEPIIVHELVHAVRNAQEGFPLPGSRVFEEGLADLYDARRSVNNRSRGAEGSLQMPDSPRDLEERLSGAEDEAVTPYDRVLASFYLSALSDTYGDLPVWDFVTQTSELREDRPLRAIFEENFPESFDVFNAEFWSQPSVLSGQRRATFSSASKMDPTSTPPSTRSSSEPQTAAR